MSGTPQVFLALVLLGVGLHAAETRLRWPAWEIPGAKIVERGGLSIAEDAEAESVREVEGEAGKKAKQHVSLEQRVSRRGIAKGGLVVCRTPLLAWKDVVPGVYEIRARVRFEGDLGTIGTPIVLTAGVDATRAGSTSWSTCDFREDGVYTELRLLYEVDPTFSKRLTARSPRHALSTRGWYQDAYPDWEPEPAPPPPAGFRIALELPKTKYDSKTGMPPNSLRRVNVDWLDMRPYEPSSSITVRYVRPAKVWVRPGMTNPVHVGLENFTDAPHVRTLVVSLTRGFNKEQEVYREEVDLAPGAARTVSYDWRSTAATPRWGYEVRAEIRQGDTVDSSARDFFQVGPRVYPIHIMGSKSRRYDPFRENESYQNLVEVFGATPGDCARVMPKHENWLSGMFGGGSAFTIPIVRAMVRGNQAQGIASHMYLFAGGTGTAIMDLFVEHPEWMASRAVATDAIYGMRTAREEVIRHHDWSRGYVEPAHENVPHIEQHLNHWFPELKARIEEETLQFARATGYEGIRFDVGIFAPRTTKTVLGTELPYDMENAQSHAAGNFADYCEKLRAEFPDFEFGANMDSWAYLEQVGNRDVTPTPPEEYPEFVAFARAGGMFMDEGTMSAPFFDHYMNKWEDALWGMAQKRDVTARLGGVYQLFSPHRDGSGHFAHDDIYWAVCIVASGSHYVGSFSAPPYTRDSVGQFVTRFSEFFWSTSRRLLPGAHGLVYVDAPADVWYADVTSYEDVGDRRRYVIPLINPPVTERLRRNKVNELPAPIDEPFAVKVTVPDGFSKAEAWMLTWEPRVMSQQLKAKLAGDVVSVVFPALQLFRALVVEFAP